MPEVEDPIRLDGEWRKKPSKFDVPDSAATPPLTGEALICELAVGKLFGDYLTAFPNASRDAGDMLRVAVQIGLVDRYQDLLARALKEKRPVPEGDWHELCAKVPWPRPLPKWQREPPQPVVIGPCPVGPNSPLAWPERTGLLGWLFDDSPTRREPFPWRRSLVKVAAIAVCTAIVGLALPPSETFDFWIAIAALVVALIAAAL